MARQRTRNKPAPVPASTAPGPSPRWPVVAAAVAAACLVAAGLWAANTGWFRGAAAAADDLGEPRVNAATPPGAAPPGMVWIPGGVFWMGSPEFEDAQPIHKVLVDGFWMDATEVTNAEFRRFVEETGHITTAEKTPDRETLERQLPPGGKLDLKQLVPGSLVFTPTPARVDLHDFTQWWRWVPGACWRCPEGPESGLAGRDKHPVVHVSHEDALAYCAWRSKKEGGTFRLPSEAEWEFAARGGLDRKTFVWGDTLRPQGKPMANTWQGEFPHHNTLEDGFLTTAPVGSFAANGFGLHDMAGNVWEWCADWYDAGYYRKSPNRNPRGPQASYDPQEPGVAKRSQRGGSFLCSDEYCKRYVPGSRGRGEPLSTTNHIGFRCVKAGT